MRFTQTNVKALVLPPGKTDHIEWETGTGLGYRLRLAADGKTVSRTWVVQYRHGGHTRRMSQPAGKLDAESARRWAKSVNARVALGQDVQVEKRAAAQPKHTFKSTVSDYLRFARRKVRARSYVEKERYLTGWYLKPLHGLAPPHRAESCNLRDLLPPRYRLARLPRIDGIRACPDQFA